MTARIAIVGVAGPAPGGIARERLEAAALVAGGARLLERCAPAGARTVPIGGDLAPALDAIAAEPGPVAVLASGDPGFFGIVRALGERFGHGRLEVLPAPSSVALAFARAGMPWDDAIVASAHGRAPDYAVNAALAHPKVAVLTAPGFTPADLARRLKGSDRRLVVGERLGQPDERAVEGTPEQIARAEFAEPNVVLALDPTRTVGPKRGAWPPRGPAEWALADGAFAHRDGMITKSEVRALVLARLGPRTGDLVWDVGAGSGSVAVECARLGAACIAVERDAGACELVRSNAERHGVAVRVVHGTAPAALADLPDPDAAFLGGGGGDLPAILAAIAGRARRAVVVALAALERVAPAAVALERAGLAVEATMLQASRLRPLAGAHRLAAENPVFVVAGTRRQGRGSRP